MDLYFAEREKYLNELVDSVVACVVKMHNKECTGRDCESCERRRVLLSCMEGMDDFSRLVLNDRIEATSIRYIKDHPTEEEVERRLDEKHKMRVKAIKRAAKEANREWLATGQWIYFVAGFASVLLVPLIVILSEFTPLC